MATIAQAESIPPRRAADGELAGAIDLGWRVAALHALSPTTLAPPSTISDDLLLNRGSLPAADRLELELRAIAGVAERAGVPLAGGQLQALFDLAAEAPESEDGERRFRQGLAHAHLAIEKRLWATDEDRGRAYEVGNFLSDTWNRVVRPRTSDSPHAELREIFGAVRVQRMKVLLDTLQTRLDPAAVHVVENHLDAWRDAVAARLGSVDPATLTAATCEPVKRQTTIWRQMLTGDKEPEAYIGRKQRGEVRDELTRQLRRRYLRYWWVAVVVGIVGGLAGFFYALDSDGANAALGTIVAVAGMLGITRATMTATVKRGLQNWGELMWNRSLATVICRETLFVDELLPP